MSYQLESEIKMIVLLQSSNYLFLIRAFVHDLQVCCKLEKHVVIPTKKTDDVDENLKNHHWLLKTSQFILFMHFFGASDIFYKLADDRNFFLGDCTYYSQ